jgi:hypothetical protein
VFLDLMAYLDLKGEGDGSMPEKRWPRPDARSGAPFDPRDMVKAGLPASQSPADENSHPSETVSETDAMSCAGIFLWSAQPPGYGAMSSEGIQGDEWGTYVALVRTTGTNAGSPKGREPYGDGGPVVVVGVTPHQGVRESRTQGQGG